MPINNSDAPWMPPRRYIIIQFPEIRSPDHIRLNSGFGANSIDGFPYAQNELKIRPINASRGAKNVLTFEVGPEVDYYRSKCQFRAVDVLAGMGLIYKMDPMIGFGAMFSGGARNLSDPIYRAGLEVQLDHDAARIRSGLMVIDGRTVELGFFASFVMGTQRVQPYEIIGN